MSDHPYLPKDLPLLPDHVLLRTYRMYRSTCAMYEEAEGLDASAVEPQLTALRDATAHIEEELHARGIGAEPWWSEQTTHENRWRLEKMPT